jgi:hypothetical protein
MTKSQILSKLKNQDETYKVTFTKANGKKRVMKFITDDMAVDNIPGAITVQELTKDGDLQWRSFKVKNVLEIGPATVKKATVKPVVKAKASVAMARRKR